MGDVVGSADRSAAGAAPGPAHAWWRRYRRHVPTSVAWLCRAVGVVALLSAAGALGGVLVTGTSLWSGLPPAGSAAAGMLYLVVAHGLARRRRTAWAWLIALLAGNVVLLAIDAATGSGVGGPWVARTAVSVALVALLLASRQEFAAVPAAPRRWTTAALLGGLVVAGPVTGWLVLTLFSPATATGPDRFGCALSYVLRGLFTTPPPDVQALPPAWIPSTTGVLGTAAILLAAVGWLRPVRWSGRRTADDEARLRDLIARHGDRDSLGYFALRDDKAAMFSRSGKAAVCYRVVGGVSLASGDPIGDPEAWPGAIHAWLEQAHRHGWTPAVLGVGEQGAQAYARSGLRALEIGDEAVVDATAFSLEGRAMRVVRQAANRVRRAGYTVRVFRVGDVPEGTVADLGRYVDAWRDGPIERGFSMALGRIAEHDDLQYLIVEARDAAGVPRAVLGFVPWGADSLSLDLMRRDRGGDNGLFEFMITELLVGARALGVRRVSLNFAMFRSTFARGERIGAGPVLRAWRSLLRLASRWWQLESLYRANLKYTPTWVPRYVCYPRGRDLPRVALAAAVAEGFLTAPGGPGPATAGPMPASPAPVSHAPEPAPRPLVVVPVEAGRR